MSAYSIVNLREEVEDSMGERASGIEGRFARKHLDSEHLGVSYLRYSPGVRSPSAHSHRDPTVRFPVRPGNRRHRIVTRGSTAGTKNRRTRRRPRHVTR